MIAAGIVLTILIGSPLLVIGILLGNKVYSDYMTKKKFPHVVNNYGIRINKIPSPELTTEKIEKGMDLLLNRINSLGMDYDMVKVKEMLSKVKVTFRPSEDVKTRMMTNEWGQKFAGSESFGNITVTYLPQLPHDGLHNTSLFHEICHTIHLTKNIRDYDHNDTQMWVDVVEWCKNEVREGRL